MEIGVPGGLEPPTPGLGNRSTFGSSHEVVELGGGSCVVKGHRVTLSEFVHELENTITVARETDRPL